MYRVLTSLRVDMNEGWIWIQDDFNKSRSILRISNIDNNKKVTCEGLTIDENYIYEYNHNKRHSIDIKSNKNTIVMSEWYRKKLGIYETNKEFNLRIEIKTCTFYKITAGLNHPQIIVRLSVGLAIWSCILGVIGIVMGIFSFFN